MACHLDPYMQTTGQQHPMQPSYMHENDTICLCGGLPHFRATFALNLVNVYLKCVFRV